ARAVPRARSTSDAKFQKLIIVFSVLRAHCSVALRGCERSGAAPAEIWEAVCGDSMRPKLRGARRSPRPRQHCEPEADAKFRVSAPVQNEAITNLRVNVDGKWHCGDLSARRKI